MRVVCLSDTHLTHELMRLEVPDLDPSMDLFDRVQLDAVREVCRRSSSLSEAGRVLFAASRSKKKAPNDADRLRKYLARFGLSFESANVRI